MLLVPIALFAQQVLVDTVIRVPEEVGKACFFPDLNKLYAEAPDGYLVLDCSTYQLRPKIPAQSFLDHCSWDWRDQKLYVLSNPSPDSTTVVDVAADSVIGYMADCRDVFCDAYLSDIDVRFKPAKDTLCMYDCRNDAIKRRLPIFSTCASWDSVGHKLYVGQGADGKLYVYDYLRDSCLKVIDVSAIPATEPDACVFSHKHRRAYVSSYQFDIGPDRVGILDTDRDTLLHVLPVRLERGLYRSVVVNDSNGKAYMVDCDGWYEHPDTMWVVDCATDSVLKKFECAPESANADQCMRWVPWSNRIYLISELGIAGSSLVVIDCNTDSVIVSGMLRGGMLYDIQLDPIRRRIFVTGDTDKVFVLHDSGYAAVQETPNAEGRAMNVSPTIVRGVLSLRGATSHKLQAASLLDIAGRKVLDLRLGANNVQGLAPGAYFVRSEPSAVSRQPSAVTKVVVTR